MHAYVLLAVCVVCEVFATTMLKISNGFKKPLPTLGVITGYGIAFYLLSLALKDIPIGVAYAVWGGLATALTALVGIMVYKEHFNRKNVIGIVLIISGVILLT